jgi:tetratricopeptide (TPR) repeat protein
VPVRRQSTLVVALALVIVACLAVLVPPRALPHAMENGPLTLIAPAFVLGVAVCLLGGLARRALAGRAAARVPRPATAEAAQELYHRGVAAREAGRAAAAAELLEAAVRADPEHARAHGALAELATERGDHQSALLHAVRALRSSDALDLHLAAARAYARVDRAPDALFAFRDVIAREPGHLAAWRGLRDLAVAAERWADALPAQERVVALTPDGPARAEEQDGLAGIHYELGRRRLAEGDHRAARLAFEAARRAKADFLPALVALGDAHQAEGRGAAALAVWEAGLAAGPALPLLSRIEHLHRAADRPRQMITLYEQAVLRWPDSLAVAVQLGRVYFELSMLDEAAEQFEKIEVRAADLPVIHAFLGAIFERRGQAREAFEEYRHLIRLASSFDWPHRCRACGAGQPRWMERCRACGRWNTSQA